MNNDKYQHPNDDQSTWSFHYTTTDGEQTIKSFDSDSWLKALQEFVYFLKGAGFELEADDIQVKGQPWRHDSDWYGAWCDAADDNWDDQFTDEESMYGQNYNMYGQLQEDECSDSPCDECLDCDCMDEEDDDYPMATPEDERQLGEKINHYKAVLSKPPSAASIDEYCEAAEFMYNLEVALGINK
jgi:hypothetical protein